MVTIRKAWISPEGRITEHSVIGHDQGIEDIAGIDLETALFEGWLRADLGERTLYIKGTEEAIQDRKFEAVRWAQGLGAVWSVTVERFPDGKSSEWRPEELLEANLIFWGVLHRRPAGVRVRRHWRRR